MIVHPSRRTTLVLGLALAVSLGGCGRRGGLELPGETPSPIGGPTPPTPPGRVQANAAAQAGDPANPPQRTPGGAEPSGQRNYDPARPVGRRPMQPSGSFILDPLL